MLQLLHYNKRSLKQQEIYNNPLPISQLFDLRNVTKQTLTVTTAIIKCSMQANIMKKLNTKINANM